MTTHRIRNSYSGTLDQVYDVNIDGSLRKVEEQSNIIKLDRSGWATKRTSFRPPTEYRFSVTISGDSIKQGDQYSIGLNPIGPIVVRTKSYKIPAMVKPRPFSITETHRDGRILRSSSAGLVRPSLPDRPFNNFGDRNNLTSSAANFAAGRLQGAKASMGIALLEGKQTVLMITEKSRAIYRAFKLARSGKFRQAANVIAESLGTRDSAVFRKSKEFRRSKNYKVLESANAGFASWLELQFGWQQLLTDITEINDVLSSLNDIEKFPRIKTTGSFSETRYASSDNYRMCVNTLRTGTTSNCFYGGFRGEYEGSAFFRGDYALGNVEHFIAQRFGVANPLEIAWDLLPYSFVLDWFIPLSTSFKNVTAEAGLTKLGSSVTIRETGHVEYFIPPGITEGDIWTNYRSRRNSLATVGSHSVHIDRKINVGIGGLTAIPTIRYPKTLWHAITTVALINQRL